MLQHRGQRRAFLRPGSEPRARKVCELSLKQRIEALSFLEGGGVVRGAGFEPAEALATRSLTRGLDLKSRPFDQTRVPPRLGCRGWVSPL